MSANDVKSLLGRLSGLRTRAQQTQSPSFWTDYVSVVKELCLAQAGHVLIADEDGAHVRLMTVDDTDSLNQTVPLIDASCLNLPWFPAFVQRGLSNGFAVHQSADPSEPIQYWLVFRLQSAQPMLLWLACDATVKPRLNELVLRGRLIADVPKRLTAEVTESSMSEHPVVALLDVFVQVYGEQKFATASYTLVNQLVASLPSVDQVVLGWHDGEYANVQAISHFDRFEKKTDTVRLYEAALEECMDQAVSIHHAQPDATHIRFAMQQLKAHLGCDDLATLPIFDDEGQVVGSLLLVRLRGQMDVDQLQPIEWMLLTLAPKLTTLHFQQKRLRIRLKKALYDGLSWLFGKEWVWVKLLISLLLMVLLWLLYGNLSFRIEANGQFETDQTQLVTAPYDGFIHQVHVTSGDVVENDQVLVTLKTDDLLLQWSEVLADEKKYQAETAKARAAYRLAEAEIAQAKQAQVQAKKSRLELMLNQATIHAPFRSVVVEGERRELLGAPVQKGQSLLQLTRIDGLYLTLKVPEVDIHLVHEGDRGEFALVSQPLTKMPFAITQIIPVGKTDGAQGAYFVVKGQLDQSAEPWWRPGMTGVAKIDKGDAAPYWVLGRRLYHRLRLWLWW